MPIHVLMLGWEYPPAINGGLGIASSELVGALSKRIPLRLLIPTRSQPEEQDSSGQMQRLSRHPLTEKPSSPGQPSFGPYADASKAGAYGEDIIQQTSRFSQKILLQAESEDFDLIHAHDWMTFEAGLALKQYYRKPLILHIHSLETDRSGAGWPHPVFRLERKAMQEADCIIAVSRYTATQIQLHYGIPADKIEVVHNAIRPQRKIRTKKPFPEKMILYAGRLARQKGPDLYLDMAAALLSRRSDIRFVLAGQGEMLGELLEKTAHASIGDRVHFAGFLDRKDMQKALSMADICVIPSRSEPFGLIALEAAACDLPIVISKDAGVNELLKGPLKCEPDGDELADAVELLLNHASIAEKSAELATQSLYKHSWEQAASQVMAIYDRLLTPPAHD